MVPEAPSHLVPVVGFTGLAVNRAFCKNRGTAPCSADLQIGVDCDDVRQDAHLEMGATNWFDTEWPRADFCKRLNSYRSSVAIFALISGPIRVGLPVGPTCAMTVRASAAWTPLASIR